MRIDLDRERVRVMRALSAAMAGSESDRARLLGVKGSTLAAATATDRALRRGPTMPAIERYTGVLYEALDHRSLTSSGRSRLASCCLIVSGLWGLVAPRDPIPDYRLKMGAALPGLGKLSTWWRGPLTDALDERVRGRLVWDLLPNEHAAAWDPSSNLDRVCVRFLDRARDGSVVTVSHENKALKGALVRHLVAEPGTTADTLAAWRHPWGFRVDRSLTEVRGSAVILSLVRATSGRR
jgi:cytoplasmic iron level regulating protein YaaA (DUF328/UPF0246 family)